MRGWLVAGAVVTVGLVVAWVLAGGEGVRESGTRSEGVAQRKAPWRSIDRLGAAEASLVGRVFDGGGKGIGGANVCGWLVSSESTARPICTLADRQGRFELDAGPPGWYRVTASARGYRPSRYRDADATPGDRVHVGHERSRRVELFLRRGGVRVDGVVRDATGGVVPGALVWARSLGPVRRAVAGAIADEHGRFALVATRGELQVMASAVGYTQARATTTAPGRFVTLELLPESVLTGRVVVAGSETPVGGVLVRSTPPRRGGTSRSVRSDADGRFEIGGLAPGVYHPDARAERAFGVAEFGLHLGLGDRSEPVTIALHTAFVVEGTVTRSGSAACVGGEGTLIPEEGDLVTSPVSRDGTARFDGVFPGQHEISWSCPAAAPSQAFSVHVRDADVLGLNWDLPGGYTIAGRVDAEGAEPAAITVRAYSESGSAVASTVVEGGGEFALQGLPNGLYTLSAYSDAHASPPQEFAVSDADVGGVRIELGLGPAVAGRVVDASGAGVRGVQVSASTGRDAPKPHAKSVHVRDDGSFRMPGLREGPYQLAVQGQRWVALPADKSSPTIVDVPVAGTVNVTLAVAAFDGVLTGRVVDPEGTPLQDALVEAGPTSSGAGRGAGGLSAMTDADGRFRIEQVQDAEYELIAYAPGGGEGRVAGVRIAEPTDIEVAAPAVIVGLVEGASGQGPPDRFELAVRPPSGGARREAFFRTEGRLRVEGLAPGEYSVHVRARGAQASIEGVVLAAGEVRDDLRIALRPNVRFRGRLVDAQTGDPVVGVRVLPLSGVGLSNAAATGRANVSDAEGQFELDGPAASSFAVGLMAVAPSAAAYRTGVRVDVETIDDSGELGDVRVQRRAPAQ